MAYAEGPGKKAKARSENEGKRRVSPCKTFHLPLLILGRRSAESGRAQLRQDIKINPRYCGKAIGRICPLVMFFYIAAELEMNGLNEPARQ
jgi:hypothetical protein